jgi:hypothetical protein
MPFSLVKGVSPYRAHSSCPKIALHASYYARESNNVRSCVAQVLFGHVPKPPRVWKATRDDALWLTSKDTLRQVGKFIHIVGLWMIRPRPIGQAVRRVLPVPIGGMLDKELSNRGAS